MLYYIIYFCFYESKNLQSDLFIETKPYDEFQKWKIIFLFQHSECKEKAFIRGKVETYQK